MQFKILLVEDNPGDVELTKEALNKSQIDNLLTIANDGEELSIYSINAMAMRNPIDPILFYLT